MQRTIDETDRRRKKQMDYNELHGIVPTPIIKKSSARELISLYGGEEEEMTKGKTTAVPPVRKSKDIPAMKKVSSAPRPYIEEEHDTGMVADPVISYMDTHELEIRIEKTNAEMLAAARKTDFIEAARLRDELISLKEMLETKKLEETNGI